MGFSSIAKTPVSHGVEPHDLETVRTFAFVFSSLKLPASPRPNYRASGFVLISYAAFRHGVLAPQALEAELERLNAMPVDIPADLEQQVRDHLAAHPEETWDQAVRAVGEADEAA
jgi:hypothetical protein